MKRNRKNAPGDRACPSNRRKSPGVSGKKIGNLKEYFMYTQLKLLVQLKWKIFIRFIKEIPVAYLVVLVVLAATVALALTKISIAVTWKSLLTVAAVQTLLCTQVKYKHNKDEFLKQYRYMHILSLFIDTFVLSVPFLFLDIRFWMISVLITAMYLLFAGKGFSLLPQRIIIPSPFFAKSAYLWHSQYRIFVPALWLLILFVTIMAYRHQNFNLAAVALGASSFVTMLIIIFQQEEKDFVTIYLNARHFMRRTLHETLYNAFIFVFPLAVLQLILFPHQWITRLGFVFLILLGLNMLWIKYIFYPSSLISALFLFVGMLFQAGCALSIYGTALIPVYYLLLYYFCKKRVEKILTFNEGITY